MRAGGVNSVYTVGAAMMRLSTLCLLCVCFLAGCTLPRREANAALFTTATPVGFSSDVRYYSADWRGLEVRLTERLERVRNASPDGTVSVLALSGGGAAGAFGAGALIGLSRRGERPEFQVVSNGSPPVPTWVFGEAQIPGTRGSAGATGNSNISR